MDRICATIPAVARDRCPDMEDMAQVVANKHGKALLLFSNILTVLPSLLMKCYPHFVGITCASPTHVHCTMYGVYTFSAQNLI